jgi:D-alanyl-lipoteichoic acid acyltransferase DltB (MBOAT superfamily)
MDTWFTGMEKIINLVDYMSKSKSLPSQQISNFHFSLLLILTGFLHILVIFRLSVYFRQQAMSL